MTQAGETGGYTASDHAKAIIEHTGKGIIDYCLINTGRIPPDLFEKYKGKDAYPVAADKDAIERLGCKVVEANVINTKNLVRHNSEKLAKIIVDLIGSVKKHGA